jgi:phospholipase C
MAPMTRREALRSAGAVAVAAGTLGSAIEELLARAAAAAPRTGRLKDIEHVVILMQENRSFDHYFGTLSGVRGFSDKHGRKAFFQKNRSGKTIHPFHLKQQCMPDLTHDWGPQHQAWHGGKMDRFVTVHQQVDGAAIGPETMGCYTRSDLAFYYALADAFTICDRYHGSVIGPTDPNRLLSMSGTLDPDGRAGGPLVETLLANRANRFSWTTMPEQLEARRISWKVYTDIHGGGAFDSVLPYFKQYSPGSTLAKKGMEPTYPADFMSDVAHDRLPAVSWLLPSVVQSEHPGFSGAQRGETVARQIFETLVSHPKVWKRTALFITWDENGGFFDHVAPPTPPPGTKGEYLTVARLPDAAKDIRGPIGLGFRVPMLVVSPFSRGGLVSSEVFDHTSTLRFIERRFGAEVPNLSAWRRAHTGDLTGAFNFAAKPNFTRPRLPAANVPGTGCTSADDKTPVVAGPFPRQERGRRRRPRGLR